MTIVWEILIIVGIIVGLVVIIIAVTSWRALWAMVKSILFGERLGFGRTDPDGTIHLKCPRCGSELQIAKGQSTDMPMECNQCGLKGNLKLKNRPAPNER